MSDIVISKPGQFNYENRSWIRLLEFFKQENTMLKNRLAEVVDQKADRDFLALAEQFQNKFIVKDEFIDELRHDINKQLDEIVVNPDRLTDQKLLKNQQKLRNEMVYFEKEFTSLRNEFNKYLSDYL
ncbi:MAG: hypothetical protein IPH68_06330 [Chitinophagaceae bacterium]|nr:hypothetical protein [Chitinophagaceae bacterium]MBK7122454.1 hypothetical protein [Chitinophagaceae bacterium]MBK8496781.1 hypothetical protein [Chitinophagaceae bacterium]MBK9530847.1 hypothetical protein [Chitinophagaceae bacterium]